MGLIHPFVRFARGILRNRKELAAENLAPREQPSVQREKVRRPGGRTGDRIFRAVFARIWAGWGSAFLVVQPETPNGECPSSPTRRRWD